MLKYSKIKLNWRIQITVQIQWFLPRPPLNVLAPAFLWLQYKFHNILRKQNGCRENLNILRLKDARKTHFCTFSMIWGTFCTHQNHCYLYVIFSSQPQSTNFEQNLTGSLQFIGFTSEVGGASSPTLVWAIVATHWRKRTQIWDQKSSTKDTWDIDESIYEVKILAR